MFPIRLPWSPGLQLHRFYTSGLLSFSFPFFLGWACCFIMGRCTTNMTTAKQSTIITLVLYFFEYIFFLTNNWTRSIVVCLQMCCRFWWYVFVGFLHQKIVARVWRTNKAWRWRHWSRFKGLDVFAFFRFSFIGAGDGGPVDVHGFKIKATISWTMAFVLGSKWEGKGVGVFEWTGTWREQRRE